MKMSKRSRKLALSAGMLVAVASIPPAPPAEAACTLHCPDGTVYTCEFDGCNVYPEYQLMTCGRGGIYFC